MKLDKNYSGIKLCPETGLQLSLHQIYYSDGVCAHCGHNKWPYDTHRICTTVKWLRPTFFEWLCGKRKRFITKDELDKNGNPVSCEVD